MQKGEWLGLIRILLAPRDAKGEWHAPIRILFAPLDAKGEWLGLIRILLAAWGAKARVGGWRLLGHLADGSVGLGEDDGRAVAGVGTGMGVGGRRRLSSCGERGENEEWRSVDRCRPRSVAGDSAGADCGLDRGGEKCGAGLFGVEAGVSRELAGCAGSAGRLSEGNAGVAAAAIARARWTLHDGTDA